MGTFDFMKVIVHSTKMGRVMKITLIFLITSCITYARPQKESIVGGSPWPLPQVYTASGELFTLNANSFKFLAEGGVGLECNIVASAFNRYYKIIFDHFYWKLSKRGVGHFSIHENILSLNVTIEGSCENYPSLESSEAYTLSIKAPNSELKAASVWGFLRGIETFSQLLDEDETNALVIAKTEINDFPRFPHRGMLIDSSRHFINKKFILDNLDAMAYNKLNVLHWHIVDDQAFPYQSKVFPDLSRKGAYLPEPDHVYTQEDIKEIIEYARLRGIRVVAEFDTPGHSQSWGKAVPGLLAKCCDSKGQFNGNYGPIDPTNEDNYVFLAKLFKEIADVFPDKYIHIGGDEVSFNCWKSNPNITKWMQVHNIKTYGELEQYFEVKLIDILNKLNHGYIVWQEIIDNGVKVRNDTVAHVWLGQGGMSKTTALGYRTLISSNWYLNYVGNPYGQDWRGYYNFEPYNFQGTDEQKKLVIGGEFCMWGEYVDGTNLIQRSWPRGSAPAERLWSAQDTKLTGNTIDRLKTHRCRMVRRGLNAEPVNGSSMCKHEYDGIPLDL